MLPAVSPKAGGGAQEGCLPQRVIAIAPILALTGLQVFARLFFSWLVDGDLAESALKRWANKRIRQVLAGPCNFWTV